MKLIFLIVALFSFSALANVTPAQMKKIRVEANNMMYEVGAEGELSPEIVSVKVIDQLGSRVKVQFVYEEAFYGPKTCSFYFDLDFMKAVPRSALCNP